MNTNYDANVWDWDLVTSIFKCPESEELKNLEASDYKYFVKRVTDYFKPTNGRFCRIELTNSRSRFLARTACYLLDFLIASPSPEAEKILDEFVKDIQVSCYNMKRIILSLEFFTWNQFWGIYKLQEKQFWPLRLCEGSQYSEIFEKLQL